MEKTKRKYFVNKQELINTIKVCAYSIRDAEKFINGITNMEHMQEYPDIKSNNKARINKIVDTLNKSSDLLSKVAFTLEGEENGT